MAFFTSSWSIDLTSTILVLATIFILYIRRQQTYWSRKGLFALPSTFLFGSCGKVFTQKESFSDFTKDLYNSFKKHGQKHGGFSFLWMPTYMPIDPEIVKHVMQNDFEHFYDRGLYYNEECDPLSAHLFSLDGSKWRNLRAKLTPTFTSGKMKMMFDNLVHCGERLIVEMDKNAGKEPVNIKAMLERFTVDIIGNVAFGIECKTLENPDNEYTKHLKLFFVDGFWDNIKGIITFTVPGLAGKLSVTAVNKKLTKFFMKIMKDTIRYREENNIYRKDFLHLLLQLKNRGQLSDDLDIVTKDPKKENVNLTLNEVMAQAFVFFLAGFETASTTMTFCLFELASNPDIQKKLRDEVIQVLKKHDDKLTYDATMEMSYMDQVINETLRKYPPIPGLNRICTKDYKVPNSDLVIEKGTKVWIPVVGLQHDPEYYPNPEKFDPDRFSEENKRDRHPYAYIPFGEGPRICIGLRFGMMQTRVGLCYLLKNYVFSLNERTTVPLVFDPKSFITATKGGIWLNYKKI